jgi:adhesin transport system outer membrane protein
VLRLQTDGGFGRLAAVRASAQREESARAAAEAGVRDLREKVVADLSDYSAAAARLDAGRSAVTAALTVTESYLRQFTAGRRTWPEVLNVVREEVTARSNEVNVQANALAAGLRLQLRAGQWRPGESLASAATKEILP